MQQLRHVRGREHPHRAAAIAALALRDRPGRPVGQLQHQQAALGHRPLHRQGRVEKQLLPEALAVGQIIPGEALAKALHGLVDQHDAPSGQIEAQAVGQAVGGGLDGHGGDLLLFPAQKPGEAQPQQKAEGRDQPEHQPQGEGGEDVCQEVLGNRITPLRGEDNANRALEGEKADSHRRGKGRNIPQPAQPQGVDQHPAAGQKEQQGRHADPGIEVKGNGVHAPSPPSS